MRVRIGKWGNSLAVRIPAAHASEIGLVVDAEAELSVEGGRLLLTPIWANADAQAQFSVEDTRLVSTPPGVNSKFDLDELIAQITEENRHDETGTGSAVGTEFR
jgi:antitoxin MazE